MSFTGVAYMIIKALGRNRTYLLSTPSAINVNYRKDIRLTEATYICRASISLLIFTKNTYFFSLCFKKYYEQTLWLSLYLFNSQSIACNIFIRFPSISTTLVLVNAISVRFSQRNDVEALTSELVSRLYVFSFSIS